MRINCLIIDDEPVARKGLAEYINEVEFLTLVGQCEHPIRAAEVLKTQNVDLIYLDVQMPKLSGIDFLKTLANPPMVILTTAHPDYALEGYALNVVDYLLKPITFERFMKASQKALEMFSLRQSQNIRRDVADDHFFVKADNRIEKVSFAEVLYIEAMQNYVTIHTTQRKLIAWLTLSSLADQLPGDYFVKVHKSYVVAIPRITAIEGNEILIGDVRIPIGRNHRDEVVEKIVGNRLFRR